MLALQKENHHTLESFDEGPHKNTDFCPLSGTGWLDLLKSSEAFHLPFHQHLNPFAHAKGYCLPATAWKRSAS